MKFRPRGVRPPQNRRMNLKNLSGEEAFRENRLMDTYLKLRVFSRNSRLFEKFLSFKKYIFVNKIILEIRKVF
jgi:hypothetical protein